MKMDKQSLKKWIMPGALLGIIMVVAVFVSIALQGGSNEKNDAGDASFFNVRRGPLKISVTETGTISAREQEVIKSEVEGQTTILSLVPEGTQVKKGDLLVELDASKLEDELVNQQISVQNAEAAFVRASENLAVIKNQAQSDTEKAELDYQFAKEDLKKYIEGEYPQELKDKESKITLAKQQLENTSDTFNWSSVLYKEKYISESELDADRLAMEKAKLDLEVAQGDLALLKNYTYNRNLTQLESDVKQAEMALERTRRKAKADVVQAEADLRAKESEYKRQVSKLEKLEEQIRKTKIYAPINGFVVYATTGQMHRFSSQEPLEEGKNVREREELIYLPTADAMMAEIKIHESNLDKVKTGMPVTVTVDALPGKRYMGTVAKIAPLPDAQSMWMNPDLKVYNTQINIDNVGNELRTGMSCSAEIIIQELEDALYVPVQCVLRVNGQPTVYVLENKEIAPRPVEIGLDNNRMIHIISGLSEGEPVLLTPPLAAATVSESTPGTGVKEGQPAGTGSELPAPSSGEAIPSAARVRQDSAPTETSAPVGISGEQRGTGREGGGEPGSGRRRFENLSEEERNKLRAQFENMSEEERAKFIEQRSRGNRDRAPQNENSAPGTQ